MSKIIEALGLTLILLSWGLSWWNIDKYSRVSSQLYQDSIKIENYHYHISGILLNRLEKLLELYPSEELTNNKEIKKIALYYEVTRISEKSWNDWKVRKKWLDVTMELTDYIRLKSELLENYEKIYNLKKNILREKIQKQNNMVASKLGEIMIPLKTLHYGLPYVDENKLSSFSATELQKNLMVFDGDEHLKEAYKFAFDSINEKVYTKTYLFIFILGSLLIVYSKIHAYKEEKI